MEQSTAAAQQVVRTADGSATLATATGESYKSLHGAVSEARHVYLQGSGIADRLERGAVSSVLEVGFGTGLNFLVTAAAAQAASTDLVYRSLELDLPSAELLAQLDYAANLAPSELPHALLAWRRSLAPKPERGWYTFSARHVRLELFIGDALGQEWHGDWQVDAIYHDAFSPASAPQLWSGEFLARLTGYLKPNGNLVSFSVASGVRRALEALGLEVAKLQGPPGGKREVLRATANAAGLSRER